MNNVNKTLYIPLFGKALVSKQGIILQDRKAEEIWETSGFSLKGKAASKWLAYYMGMRAAVFDRWLIRKMEEQPRAVVLHLGCGLDSRCQRVGSHAHPWFDIDLPEVIRERKKFYAESEHYIMLPGDLRSGEWLAQIPGNVPAIVVMEGVSMYLRHEELRRLMDTLTAHFSGVSLLTDCYTCFAAKASKYKNPINAVGVTQVWGIDDPAALAAGTGMCFLVSHSMTPTELIGQLSRVEQIVFPRLYCGKMADKLYRLYEFTAS